MTLVQKYVTYKLAQGLNYLEAVCQDDNVTLPESANKTNCCRPVFLLKQQTTYDAAAHKLFSLVPTGIILASLPKMLCQVNCIDFSTLTIM